MLIKEDLIYFLKNGKFEHINFGIRREQLIEILGEPDFIPVKRNVWNAGFYAYDNFEFYFEIGDYTKNARFASVVLNHPNEYKNSPINFKSYGWNTNLTLEDGLHFLKENNIEFSEKPFEFGNDGDTKLFETKSGVRIIFDAQLTEGTVFTFYKLAKSVEFKSPSKPSTKQVSVTIEEKYYEKLRKKAEDTKESIANQCRKIIENYLKEEN